MNETVQRLVDAIKTGDALETENAFQDAMAEKLSNKIEDLRIAVAQNMFDQPETVAEEYLSEEDEDLALVVENATDDFDADEITLSEEEVAELVEKYEGFSKMSGELAAKGAKNPAGLAAWIGRKKYGKEKFQKAAADMNEDIIDSTGKVIKKVAQTAGKIVGGVAKTVGVIRQTPAAIGAAYNTGRAGAQKALDK